MIPKRPALGRGLTSLMSQMAPEDASQREVPVGSLVPNRHQPRLQCDEALLEGGREVKLDEKGGGRRNFLRRDDSGPEGGGRLGGRGGGSIDPVGAVGEGEGYDEGGEENGSGGGEGKAVTL